MYIARRYLHSQHETMLVAGCVCHISKLPLMIALHE